MARTVLEIMLHIKLPRTRPEWLREPWSRIGLELDGYDQQSSIAFEYQGTQHYEQTRHIDKESVEKIKKRDARKRQICWSREIILIIIPTFPSLINVDAIINQIELAVISAGLKIPKSWKEERPNKLSDIWKPPTREIPSDLIEIASSRSGFCLSETYVNGGIKLLWKCSEEHEWFTTANAIRRGNWCKRCSAKASAISQQSKKKNC